MKLSFNQSARRTAEVRTQVLVNRGLATLLLAMLVGCGIPRQRHAPMTVTVPERFHLNNGVVYSHANAPAEGVDSQDQDTGARGVSPARWEDGKSDSGVEGDALRQQASKENITDPFCRLGAGTGVACPRIERTLTRRIRQVQHLDDVSSTRRIAAVPDEASHVEWSGGIDALPEAADSVELSVEAMGEVPELMELAASGNTTDSREASSVYGTAIALQSSRLPQDVFHDDPHLVALIRSTLDNNRELKILAEEIRIACNETYARSGEYRPMVTLGTEASFEKSGEHTRDGAVEEQLEIAEGRNFPEPLGDFLVAANLSWELDIWNRLRNAQRAAGLRYLASQDGRNYVVTRVVAEVSENYYALMALDNRLEALKKTIEIQRKSLAFAKANKAAGRATELAVRRFDAEVHKNMGEVPLIHQEIVQVENRINQLAGRYPTRVERFDVDFLNLNLHTLASGVPSELLINRSDIRQAERQVQAAGLDLEVARARFYPSLNLNAGIGWNAFRTGYLFRTPESLVYGIGKELVGPLINKRAIQADYRTANAAQLQAIYHYHQTVLEAHIEVVNHLSKVENYRKSILSKRHQLEALEASVETATLLFQSARAEYVEVLLAQRELMEARLLLIEIKKEQLSAIVNAYQALGGGGF